MGTALAISESEQHIFRKAQGYGLKAQAVDGMNVVEVESAATQYCISIKNGDGPCLLECNTYRFRGHSMFDTQLYRESEEIEEWKSKGPIIKLRRWLEANGKLDSAELKAIEDLVEVEINQSVEFAQSSEVENVRAWEKPFWAFIEKLSSNKTTVEEGTSPERARTESWLFGFGIIPVSAPRIYNNTHAQSVPPQILARGSALGSDL